MEKGNKESDNGYTRRNMVLTGYFIKYGIDEIKKLLNK